MSSSATVTMRAPVDRIQQKVAEQIPLDELREDIEAAHPVVMMPYAMRVSDELDQS